MGSLIKTKDDLKITILAILILANMGVNFVKGLSGVNCGLGWAIAYILLVVVEAQRLERRYEKKD